MSYFSDSCAFRWAVLALSIVIIAIAITNVVFFNKVRQNPIDGVSSTTAIVMMVMNILVAILALALFIWAIIGLWSCRSIPMPTPHIEVPKPQIIGVPKIVEKRVEVPVERQVEVPVPVETIVYVQPEVSPHQVLPSSTLPIRTSYADIRRSYPQEVELQPLPPRASPRANGYSYYR